MWNRDTKHALRIIVFIVALNWSFLACAEHTLARDDKKSELIFSPRRQFNLGIWHLNFSDVIMFYVLASFY